MSKKAKVKEVKEAKKEVEAIKEGLKPIVSHEGTLDKPLPATNHRKKVTNKFCPKTGVGLVTGEHAPKGKK